MQWGDFTDNHHQAHLVIATIDPTIDADDVLTKLRTFVGSSGMRGDYALSIAGGEGGTQIYIAVDKEYDVKKLIALVGAVPAPSSPGWHSKATFHYRAAIAATAPKS